MEVTKLRVLHVFNVAGVASVIAKYMDTVDSYVLTRRTSDPYGYAVSPNYESVPDGAWLFSLRCLWRTRKFDIIHIHDFDKLLPWLSRLYSKPLILHYHGSRIKGQWRQRQRYWKHASKILYSTLDLKQGNTPARAIYLPNPIDTNMFHRLPIWKRRHSALSMNKDLDRARATELAEQHGLILTVQTCNVPHQKMSGLLNQYEYYIDAKTTGFTMSKTGLEALACGLHVINRHGTVIQGLPREHLPGNVVAELNQIYECSV